MFSPPGGSFPFTVGRIQHGFDVRPDLCAQDNTVSPRQYLGKFWTDSLVHDKNALQLLVDVIGEVKAYRTINGILGYMLFTCIKYYKTF